MWWAQLLNNVVALLGNGGGAATSYESIATVTVGAGGSSTISFTSIPSTYKHLQVRLTSLTTSAVSTYAYFNTGSGTYSWHELSGNGSSAAATAGSSTNIFYVGYNASTTANYTGAAIMDILDYANTNKYKTIRGLLGRDFNGSGQLELNSGLYQKTTAVSSIKFYLGANAFKQYSHFALYGIKA